MARAAKAIRTTLVVVLCAGLLCNLWLLASAALFPRELPGVLGFSPLAVASGSMEPALSASDLAIVHREGSYRVGDVVAFWDGGSLTTHRIVADGPEGFVTKGDFNNAQDALPVAPEHVAGRVVLSVPLVGGAALFLRTPAGLGLLVVVGLAVLVLPDACAGFAAGERSAPHEQASNNRARGALPAAPHRRLRRGAGRHLRRYVTVVQGQGSGDVAAVALGLTSDSTADLTSQLQGMKPGESRTVNFAVTNTVDKTTSEVAQNYSVSIETTRNLPLKFELTAITPGVDKGEVATGSGSPWTGEDLPYGSDVTHSYTLTVTWPENASDSASPTRLTGWS